MTGNNDWQMRLIKTYNNGKNNYNYAFRSMCSNYIPY